MADFLSHAEVLRKFGKFLREEKQKIDTEYVKKIKPILSGIQYEKYSLEEIEELIKSFDEVLKSLEQNKIAEKEEQCEIHKTCRELERAKNKILEHRDRLHGKGTLYRHESGRRKDGAGLKNDSGCFSADSRLLTDNDMFVTHPSENTEGDLSLQTNRSEPVQHEDTSKALDDENDSTC